MIIFTHLPSKRVVGVLLLYNFTQIQKYFTLALLVLLVTNMMSVDGEDVVDHMKGKGDLKNVDQSDDELEIVTCSLL